MKTMKSELSRKAAAKAECRCIKYKMWIRPTDLRQPEGSWLQKLVVPCQCGSNEAHCNCDIVLSIPYGYFFHVDSKLELGDTVGPNSIYVRLISKDKFRFIIKRKWTKNCLLLDSWFSHENQTGQRQEAEVVLRKYPSLCVHYLCVFLMYKYDYEKGHLKPETDFSVPETLVFAMWEMAHDLIL